MVAVSDLVAWRRHRSTPMHDPMGLNDDLGHQVLHIGKALGPLNAVAEHRDHGEPDSPVEVKRLADLVIHSAWAAAKYCDDHGLDLDALIRDRIQGFKDGFFPEPAGVSE